jgi:hypothetical protein
VGGPADVTEPDSEDGESSSASDSDYSYMSRDTCERKYKLLAARNERKYKLLAARNNAQFRYTASYRDLRERMRRSETDTESKLGNIRSQDVPECIKHQRHQLQEFYTAWKKYKFGPSEKSEEAGTSASATDLKMHYLTKIGLRKCEELPSTTDFLTTILCQVSNAFLLFANAYPKHAPACYKMAELCFEMATFTSRVLSALWKLIHGFTLSSMESAINEIESRLDFIIMTFYNVFFCFQYLYSLYVNDVTKKKSFERDEEFQIGYEQPPTESQISAFIRVADVDTKKLGEIILQIRKLVEPPIDPKEKEVSGHGATDPSEQEKVSGLLMEVEESGQPNTLSDVVLYIEELQEHMGTVCSLINVFRI